MTNVTEIGRPYLRVSEDKSGREVSPDEQLGDLDDDATTLNLRLGEEYRDIGSASRFATKARKAFRRLLTDLETGDFGAGVLLLWEPSRSSRDEGESFRLIDLLERTGVKLWIHGYRMFDPASSWQDRHELMRMALDSAKESYQTSDRVKRSHRRMVGERKPAGPVGFGLTREYDPVTGKLLGRVLDPERAPLAVELFEHLAAGRSLRSIAADWRARGVLNGAGKPYTPAQLRSMVRSRHFIGERVWIRDRRRRTESEPQVIEGVSPKIVEPELYWRVQEILADPERRKIRPGRGKHLLSMIGKCDRCGGRLHAKTLRGQLRYACLDKGCVSVPYDELNDLAEDVVLGYLSDPAQYTALAQPDEKRDADLAAAAAEASQIRTELAELEAAVSAGTLGVAFAARVEPGLRERLGKAERRARELSAPPKLSGVLEPGPDVARRWKVLEMEQKREVVRLLLVPELIGELRVSPVGPGRKRVPVEERVQFARS